MGNVTFDFCFLNGQEQDNFISKWKKLFSTTRSRPNNSDKKHKGNEQAIIARVKQI